MRTLSRVLVVVLCSILSVLNSATAQQVTAPVQGAGTVDPSAALLIQKAMTSLSGGAVVSDIMLTGTATRIAGSEIETGAITLKAFGPRLSRIDFSTSSGIWTEIRGLNAQGLPVGSWSGPDGAAHKLSGHNMMTDAAWFFPALSGLSLDPAKNPSLSISYIGQEDRNGVAVTHLRLFRVHSTPANPPANQKAPLPNKRGIAPPQVEHLTAVDFYLDASSSLPAALEFNTHPDGNAAVDIPVEVEFSDYQNVDGRAVPFHIQESLNGTLYYDITIQSANTNLGLSATEFAVPPAGN